MLENLDKIRNFGLGNKTAFFNLTYYTYHQGAIREVKILKVISECIFSQRYFRETYPCVTDTIQWQNKFVFKMAGLDGTFKNDKLFLDPLREKAITANYMSMIAITDWLGKPQLIHKDQKYHLGGELFTYNTIIKGAYAVRHGFIKKVVATADDVQVGIIYGNDEKDLDNYERYNNPGWSERTISANDKESVLYFTKTKEDVMRELSTTIVRFSDEEKRAEEEKVENIIGNLQATILAAKQDYSQGYPVDITIRINGRITKV